MRRTTKAVLLSVLLLVLIGGTVAFRTLRLSELAHLGTGYSAELTCACLFVSHRPLDSCRQDLDKLAQRVVTVEAGDHVVTARSLGLARATARYREGTGCALDP
jgi:hypothetical protein